MKYLNNSVMQLKVHLICMGLIAFCMQGLFAYGITSISSNSDTLLYLPSGTRLVVQLEEDINTEYSYYGRSFEATLSEPVIERNRVLIPEGAEVRGVIKASERARNIGPSAYLVLELEEVAVLDVWLPVETDRLGFTGNPSQTGAKVGVGAGVGALIGGFKGAVKGALVGLGVAALSSGKQIYLSRGAELEFYLDEAVLLVSDKI